MTGLSRGSLALLVVLLCANPGSAQTDVSKELYRDEIVHAVTRLKLFGLTAGKFKPSATVSAKELSQILNKAAVQYPAVFRKTNLQTSTAAITREKAVVMVAQALADWEKRIPTLVEISADKDPLRYFAADGGFVDGAKVTKANRQHYALLIYRGIIPDTKTLSPTSKCTRAYAAALVARTVPSTLPWTGVAFDCAGGILPQAGGAKIKLEEQVGTGAALYPVSGKTPSRTFMQGPGIVSIHPSLEVIEQRRVGANPLVIQAVRVEGNLHVEAAPAVVISPEDAAKLANVKGKTLLLHTWKVGVYNFYRTEQQRQKALEEAETPNPLTETAPTEPAPEQPTVDQPAPVAPEPAPGPVPLIENAP